MSAITTSVVICAYTKDRWTQLLAAIDSVRAQHTPADELVVVIDHNDDLLADLSAARPGLSVVASDGPKGLSGARNTGIAATTGDVVVFLDDDATAEPDWLTHLVAGYADPEVLGVGGSARPVWESGRPSWWPVEFDWVIGCSYPGQPATPAPVRNLMGCNMSVRRDVLTAVGGFDTELGRTADTPAGCEETELCIRGAELFPGGRFWFEPPAVVHHFVPAARATWTYFSARCRAEGVSKARVAKTVGQSSALAAEQAYVRRVLPAGVLRGLTDSATGRLAGAGRAAAIVAGLGLTSTGYLRSRAVSRLRYPNTASGLTPGPARSGPTLPLVLDLSESPRALDARRADGTAYATAVVLVTQGGEPLAKVTIDLPAPQLSGAELAALVRDELARQQVETGLAEVTDIRRAHPATRGLRELSATVVIATRNRPETLRECLDSVLAGSVLPDRIVVVDNAPSDDSTEQLMARLIADQPPSQPRLVYVREDHPGLARAHNAGLVHVSAAVVAFTDDDVLVERRWLQRLLAAFVSGSTDHEVACVTGMIAPRELDTVPQQWVEGNVTYDKGLHRLRFDTGINRPTDPLFPYTAGAFGSGANMAFRTDYLRERGGFDESLGTGTYAMGGDDLAAFFDVIADGRTLVYEPGAIVAHLHYREYAGLRRQTYGYGAGLGAHLMRCLVRDPRTALHLLRRLPAARARAAQIVKPATVEGLPPYPADLSRQQRLGLISGPWRYLVSRRRARSAPPIGAGTVHRTIEGKAA